MNSISEYQRLTEELEQAKATIAELRGEVARLQETPLAKSYDWLRNEYGTLRDKRRSHE